MFPDYLSVSYDYCILRNILQNKICHFYSLDQIKRDQVLISKTCPKEILNISNLVTPCLINGYFSGQYFNWEIVLELLNEYYEAKI